MDRSSSLAAENQRLRMNSLELEMKTAVQQKYQQICWPRNQLPDFSGARHETAYQTVKELHETYHWPVCKLMWLLDLHSVCGRREWTRRKKSPDEYLAESILNRGFAAKKQNEKWLTDVTGFKYGQAEKLICAQSRICVEEIL